MLAADITREADCQAIAATCVERFGRIDILHNNVGRSQGDRDTAAMDADVWDELMAMNLKGMFMTCKHVLPVMREQRGGVNLEYLLDFLDLRPQRTQRPLRHHL